MSWLIFYFRYALRSLRRDGTRTFLAGLSIAFGVMSLTAMQLLTNTLLNGIMFDQHVQYGGDAVIQPEGSESGFRTADLEQIAVWEEQGLIAEYTTFSDGSAAYMRTSTNGRVIFLVDALGIDPITYPLTGDLVLREPAGATAADVLQQTGDVLVTRDIAEQRGLHVGDQILVGGDSAPVQLTVTGIVGATPTQQGDSIFYSLGTARLIENRDDVINRIPVNWGSVPGAAQTVIDSPYNVFVAVDSERVVEVSSSTSLFGMMLKGAGVLGLLLGGISVSNTLQVILARRKLEIAMLKTLGYRQADLLSLISLETGLIGLVGGIAGTWIGIQIAGRLIDVLGTSGSIMLDWQPDPAVVIGCIIIGVLTAIVFGMQVILASSATRPLQILRDLPLKTPRRVQLGRFGLYLAMLFLFGFLIGVVLGSPLEGVFYVIVGGIALLLVRGIFWVVLWLVLKIPLPALPLLRLARANLRQRKTQASLVVIALSAGAFSVTFAASVIYNAQGTIDRVRGSDEGFNLMIFTDTNGAAEAVEQMAAQGAQDTYIAERVEGTLNGEPISIEGRDASDLNKDMRYNGDWSEADNVALLPELDTADYAIGDHLALNVGGQEVIVTLAGFYAIDESSMLPYPAPLIIPRHLAQTFSDATIQIRVFGEFPVSSLSESTTALGLALPNMLVFSRADINDARVSQYQALFTFAVSIAGLAFVAGAVLIANAAGLTVVERRREIGVFKAVGYTSWHVLYTLLSEYGFLGVLAGLFGIIGSVIAIMLINISQPGADLVIVPSILGGMLLFSIMISVVSAAVVAWQPTRVRPLDVLRYE